MPMNLKNYPAHWKEISLRIRDRAHWQCEWCGITNASIRENGSRVVLTVAHVNDPDPQNCHEENLQALCQRCHLRIDAPMHRAHAAQTRQQKKIDAGQHTFDEQIQEQRNQQGRFTFIDLFAGIGGMRLAFESNGGQCVFSSEWDRYCQKTYFDNFGVLPHGDITKIDEKDIPDHDILVAGFPCQPFSIAGVSKKNSLKDTNNRIT